MLDAVNPVAVLTVLCVSVVALHDLPAQSPASTAHMSVDLAHCFGLAKFYVPPVEARKDTESGFMIGGKNSTRLIASLKGINSRSIADLEADMRADAKSEVGSSVGFLGSDEKLLNVLTEDNRYVVDELGLSHQALAKHLHAMGTVGYWQQRHRHSGEAFVYHGRRFKVTLVMTRGFQLSPFRDGTKSGSNVTIENVDTGERLECALLVPHMIERYGFYEGKGTPYRVDPRQVLEVFDFLKPNSKQP